MNKVLKYTKECYENIEKAEALINILHEKYLAQKDTVIILEIILTNITNLTNLILEIQNTVKNSQHTTHCAASKTQNPKQKNC